MSAQTGVKLADDCISHFNEFKLRKTYGFLTFKLTDDLSQVVIDKTGAPSASYDEFLATLPANDCRYGVVNVNYSTPAEGDRSKIVFILWVPETSKIKHKMIYAGTKDTVKKGFNGIQADVQGSDKSEVEIAAIIDKCKQFSK